MSYIICEIRDEVNFTVLNILEFAMNDDGQEKLLKKLMVIFALF